MTNHYFSHILLPVNEKGKRFYIHLIANSDRLKAKKKKFKWFLSGYFRGIHFSFVLEVFCIANNKGNNLLINDQIKVPEVLVIGPNGEQVGIKSIEDARTLASYAALDLVLISPNGNPPVCKVMDYNKYRYEKQKKEKEALKRQRANQQELKEFRLSPVIDVGDFETKLKNASKYLQKGDKVKLTIRFKGRQMAHTELGREVLEKFTARCLEFAEVQDKPKLDGRVMSMLLVPKKEK